MYRACAASLPPYDLVPNYPNGSKRLILFEPGKFYAILTIVVAKLASP